VKPHRAAAKPAEAVVAAIKSSALHLLTAAALALPLTHLHAANEEAIDFQYGHYDEGARNLINAKSGFKPITVDSLQSTAKLKLADRIKFTINFSQDTWSGATPVTTAPLAFQGNRQRSIAPNVLSSASPYLQNDNVWVDKNFTPLLLNSTTGKYTPSNQLVHTLSSASPETRKQGDVHLGYDWDEASIEAGAGTSAEPDYQSVFGNLSGRLDFNQKLTSLNTSVSYTASDTHAMLDHDAVPYIQTSTFGERVNSVKNTFGDSVKRLTGERDDWTGHLGITQVLTKSSLMEMGASYTSSTGYLSNPYKTTAVIFVDPLQKIGTNGELKGAMYAFLDQRPTERNEWTENIRFVKHISALDAVLHVDYRFFHDDWNIQAHTFSSDWIQSLENGWTITPRIRYYTQNAASFYAPYLISQQAASRVSFDATGTPTITKYDPQRLPAYYSSDYRLSGYGALSGGISVTKKFAKSIEFQAGAEYYTHAGHLKLGGGGEGDYADFDGYLVNASFKVDLSSLAIADDVHSSQHHHHTHHHHHSAPAGVMFDHVLQQAGDAMVGYRYMYANQAGTMQKGLSTANDPTLVTQACALELCYVTPQSMSMNMHMLDLMYAPTDWLTLMLMPQFMDMHMSMRPLSGAPPAPNMTTDALGAAIVHAGHEHTTGGVGDTGLYAIVKATDFGSQQVNISLGISIPTGDSNIQLRDTHRQDLGYIHYGMQLGSGTWDFKPTITLTGHQADWSWGAQLSGTKRLASSNSAGFAFGDIFQSTAWLGYDWTNWLTSTVRGLYTLQDALKGYYQGTYHQIGAMDFPKNYGGQYADVGLGINIKLPHDILSGSLINFEWLQPIQDDVNGYQLPREGALSATWSYAF
jgi:hypothetical protein